MPKPSATGKRRIPTSSAMYPEEIDLVQEAARARQCTMSDFIRLAAVKEAKRLTRALARAAA